MRNKLTKEIINIPYNDFKTRFSKEIHESAYITYINNIISSWNVKYGQIIKQGDIIAKSGNAGYSSGPHLHITIREGHFQGTAVDPSKYLRTNF